MTDLAAIRAAHPVVEVRYCGNREDRESTPGPPFPPPWCGLVAGHEPPCRTTAGRALRDPIAARPPVISYRCETCRTPQDHRSPTPCATLAALAAEVTP